MGRLEQALIRIVCNTGERNEGAMNGGMTSVLFMVAMRSLNEAIVQMPVSRVPTQGHLNAGPTGQAQIAASPRRRALAIRRP